MWWAQLEGHTAPLGSPKTPPLADGRARPHEAAQAAAKGQLVGSSGEAAADEEGRGAVASLSRPPPPAADAGEGALVEGTEENGGGRPPSQKAVGLWAPPAPQCCGWLHCKHGEVFG